MGFRDVFDNYLSELDRKYKDKSRRLDDAYDRYQRSGRSSLDFESKYQRAKTEIDRRRSNLDDFRNR